jgi:hypothetical protein
MFLPPPRTKKKTKRSRVLSQSRLTLRATAHSCSVRVSFFPPPHKSFFKKRANRRRREKLRERERLTFFTLQIHARARASLRSNFHRARRSQDDVFLSGFFSFRRFLLFFLRERRGQEERHARARFYRTFWNAFLKRRDFRGDIETLKVFVFLLSA